MYPAGRATLNDRDKSELASSHKFELGAGATSDGGDVILDNLTDDEGDQVLMPLRRGEFGR